MERGGRRALDRRNPEASRSDAEHITPRFREALLGRETACGQPAADTYEVDLNLIRLERSFGDEDEILISIGLLISTTDLHFTRRTSPAYIILRADKAYVVFLKAQWAYSMVNDWPDYKQVYSSSVER